MTTPVIVEFQQVGLDVIKRKVDDVGKATDQAAKSAAVLQREFAKLSSLQIKLGIAEQLAKDLAALKLFHRERINGIQEAAARERSALRQIEAEERASIRNREAVKRAANRTALNDARSALKQLEAEETASLRSREAVKRAANRAALNDSRTALRQLEAEELSSMRIKEAARRASSRAIANDNRTAARQLEAEELSSIRTREAARKASSRTALVESRSAIRQQEAEQLASVKVLEATRKSSARAALAETRTAVKQLEAEQLSAIKTKQAADLSATKVKQAADLSGIKAKQAADLAAIRTTQAAEAAAQRTAHQLALNNQKQLAVAVQNTNNQQHRNQMQLLQQQNQAALNNIRQQQAASQRQAAGRGPTGNFSAPGLTNTGNQFTNLGSKIRQTASSLNSFRTILLSVGAGFSLRGIVSELDKVAGIQQKLAAVAKPGENTIQTFEKLKNVANASGVELEDVVQTYQKISVAADNYQLSQDGVIRVVDLLSKTLKLSGATAVESSQFLLQLSQAAGLGFLQGEEFRAAAKDNPVLINQITESLGMARGQLQGFIKDTGAFKDQQLAQSFGVTAEKLRELEGAAKMAKAATPSGGRSFSGAVNRNGSFSASSSGSSDPVIPGLGVTLKQLQAMRSALPDFKLKFQDVIAALGRNGKSVDQAVLNLGLRPSQAINALKNNLLSLVAEIDRTTGITQKLSNSILFLANNTNLLVDAMLVLGSFALPLVAAAAVSLFLALATNPITALALAVGAALSALVLFRNEIGFDAQGAFVLRGALVSLTDVLGLLGTAIKNTSLADLGRQLSIPIMPAVNAALMEYKKVKQNIEMATTGQAGQFGNKIPFERFRIPSEQDDSIQNRYARSALQGAAVGGAVGAPFGLGLFGAKIGAMGRSAVQWETEMAQAEAALKMEDNTTKTLDRALKSVRQKILIAENEAKLQDRIKVSPIATFDKPAEGLLRLEEGFKKLSPEVKKTFDELDKFQKAASGTAPQKFTRGVEAARQETNKLQQAIAKVDVKKIQADNGLPTAKTGLGILQSAQDKPLETKLPDFSNFKIQIDGVKNAFSGLTAEQQVALEKFNGIITVAEKLDQTITTIRASIAQYLGQAAGILGSVVGEIESAVVRALNNVLDLVNKIIGAINQILGALGKLSGINLGSIGQIGGGFNAGPGSNSIISNMLARGQQFGAQGAAQVNANPTTMFGDNARSYALSTTNPGLPYQQGLGPLQQYRSGLQDVVAEQRNIDAELTKLGTQGPAAFNRAAEAAQGLGQASQQTGQAMQQFLGSTISNLENAFVQFAQTGKFDFKALVNAMIGDLARLMFRMIIMQPLMNFFGGLFGGIGGFGGGGMIGGFATGGMVGGASGVSGGSGFTNLGLGFGSGGCGPGGCGKGFATGGLVGFCNGGLTGFASGGISGGRTFGPGTSTSDKLLTMTSPGEFIVNAAATKANLPALNHVNQGGTLGGEGGGGTVNYAPNVTVNVQGGGTATDGARQGQAAGREFEAMMRKTFSEMLVREMRPGGTLTQRGPK
jgi:tape measure domain-containing protein